MMSEARRPTRIRLFVALDLPGVIRDRIAAWQARELTDPALRPVAVESLHITLCFLGWTDEDRREDVARTLTRVESRAVPVRFEPVPALRPPRRPRICTLAADSPGSEELQGELAAQLAELGVYRPERRRFWPHVTVARVRTEKGTRRPRRLRRLPADLPADLVHTFESVRVALYRSNLRPEGAQYVSLASVNLPPRPS